EDYHAGATMPAYVVWGKDWYRRASLVDHFLGPAADLDGFARSEYPEDGDFVLGRYHAEIDDGVILSRVGGVWCDGEFARVRVAKRIEAAGPRSISIKYEIHSMAARELTLRF